MPGPLPVLAHPTRNRRSWICLLMLAAMIVPVHATALHIDSEHSRARFSVRVLWVKPMRGQFNRVSGKLVWTAPDPRGVVDAWIDVDSARMTHARYTHWLLSRKFFDAQRYPRIHFVSAPVALSNLARGGPLRGDLTIRGVARTVEFRMLPSPCPHPITQGCTIRVVGSIERSQFGMHALRALLSDRVQLQLTIVLVPEPPEHGR